MSKIYILVVLLALVSNVVSKKSFTEVVKSFAVPNVPTSDKQLVIENHRYNQYLDHFDPTDSRQWKQRYLINNNWWRKDGPVFLLISGESRATESWMRSGYWAELAKQYGALYFQLEHRYYGESRPTPDLSNENLVYLTSQQALADIAHFIEGMNIAYDIPAGTKWILFGGSYAGSLAAWARMKYPHLVHGSVASSAPLVAQVDFQQYYVVVGDALKTHSQACFDALAAANKEMIALMNDTTGRRKISDKFKLCYPLDSPYTTKKDITNFHKTQANYIGTVVQYNGINSRHSATGNLTIATTCDILTDEKRGSPLDRLVVISEKMRALAGADCVNTNYTEAVITVKNLTWESTDRPWTYQTCTEFGFFQSSSASIGLFGNSFPIEDTIEQCYDIFGSRYDQPLIPSVNRTNVMYGGLDLIVSNVMFIHGSSDPWHSIGKIESNDPKTPVFYIHGSAHCADMYPASDKDVPELTEARAQIRKLLGEWLENSKLL